MDGSIDRSYSALFCLPRAETQDSFGHVSTQRWRTGVARFRLPMDISSLTSAVRTSRTPETGLRSCPTLMSAARNGCFHSFSFQRPIRNKLGRKRGSRAHALRISPFFSASRRVLSIRDADQNFPFTSSTQNGAIP